jgi:hypothetical protein
VQPRHRAARRRDLSPRCDPSAAGKSARRAIRTVSARVGAPAMEPHSAGVAAAALARAAGGAAQRRQPSWQTPRSATDRDLQYPQALHPGAYKSRPIREVRSARIGFVEKMPHTCTPTRHLWAPRLPGSRTPARCLRPPRDEVHRRPIRPTKP